jgi:hypothetical protein
MGDVYRLSFYKESRTLGRKWENVQTIDTYTGEVVDEWKNSYNELGIIDKVKYIHGGPQE